MISVRQATAADLDCAEKIITAAREYLGTQGSPQWQNSYGPGRVSLERNIAKREGVLLLCGGVLCGYAALVQGVDTVYTGITEGRWEGAGDRYISIHSVALDPSVRGQGFAARFLRELVGIAGDMGFRDVRIDTHRMNTIMQRAILRAGFDYRGVVCFPIPDGERLAYQLVL